MSITDLFAFASTWAKVSAVIAPLLAIAGYVLLKLYLKSHFFRSKNAQKNGVQKAHF